MSSLVKSTCEFYVTDFEIQKISEILNDFSVDRKIQIIAQAMYNSTFNSTCNPNLRINLIHVSARLLSKEDVPRVIEIVFSNTITNKLGSSIVNKQMTIVKAILIAIDQTNNEELATDHYVKM